MAIDLVNKLEHKSRLEHVLDEVLERVGVRPDALSSEQREVLQLAYQSAISHADPRHVVGDPAAWASDFGHAVDRVAIRIDARPSEELRRQVLGHTDPAMREQALYEYVDRGEEDAIELLCHVVDHETDQQARWNALWAIEKLGGIRSIQALQKFRKAADPEIAEWAGLFMAELQTGDPVFDNRDCRYLQGRTFDETIFLLIHCDLYIRLMGSNQIWGKLSLAPQALARVYGQALACPNVETREQQLVIAKTISGLHLDGSVHVDNYLFRGFTERTQGDRGNFFFESQVKRPFYIAGRADDTSQGVQEANIGFARQGRWNLDHRFKVRGADAIRYVRGRFQGWGYVNLQRVVGKPLEEVLLPGNAILSTLHDPVVGPLTNVFISGTFKGKLNDWDGDGYIDLNSLNAYSTTEGELDTNMDGIPDQPGLACCSGPSPFPV